MTQKQINEECAIRSLETISNKYSNVWAYCLSDVTILDIDKVKYEFISATEALNFLQANYKEEITVTLG